MEHETLIPTIEEQHRPVRRPAPRRAPSRQKLAPLLAVAGLCGGAGATTLAYLVGRYEADVLTAPVLVCDTGGPRGGLAAYSGVELPRSLPRLANAVAAHQPLTGGLFADDGSGLRVLASRPRFESDADPQGVARLLKDARLAHALTIADCGTLATSTDRQVLEAASHVAWVLPATAAGVARGAGVLGLFDGSGMRQELVIARNDPAERKPPMGQLSELAESRQAPLVLMASVPDLAAQPIADALEVTAVALSAIHSVISR
jgi:hypothetical protein